MRPFRTFVCLLAATAVAGCNCKNPLAPNGGAEGTLLSLVVTGKSALQVAETSPLTATATYSDGTQQDVTTVAIWSSNASGVCTVAPGGLATGVGAGACVITALFGDVPGTLDLTVTDPSDPNSPGPPPAGSTALFVTGTPVMSIGQAQQWQAMFNEDGSTSTVTTEAAWTSDNPGVASVSPTGLVTALAEGTANILATYEGLTSSGPVQVTGGDTPSAPTVTSLAIAGVPCSAVGGSAQLQAIAQLSNGATQNVTTLAQWTSGSSIAGVAAGFVTCVAEGATQIAATYEGASASVPVAISGGGPAPQPGVITIVGAPCTAPGTTAQLQAFVSGVNVTNAVAWSTATGGVASVSSSGFLSCLGPGTTTVTADLPPHQPGSIPVTVVSGPAQADLIGLEVHIGADVLEGSGPLPLDLDLSDLLQGDPLLDLKVFGLYSDGSLQEVTHLAAIDCGGVQNPLVPCILSLDGMSTVEIVVLLLQGLLDPSHQVNVTYGGFTANVLLDVELPVLESLSLNDGNPIALSVGNQLPPLQALFSQDIQTNILADGSIPGLVFDFELADGLLSDLENLPVVGPLLLGQINQVLDGLTVVDGVLTLAPSLVPVLDGILNNALLESLGLEILPLDLTATLDGITSAPIRLNLGG